MDIDTIVVVAGVILTIALSLVIRRGEDSVDRAARSLDSASAKAELYANAERSRNLPPPSAPG